MCAGDVGDQGEAGPEPVRAGGSVRRGVLEGLEQTVDLVRRHDGARVGHGQRRFGATGCEADLDVSTPAVVTDGVVDEV